MPTSLPSVFDVTGKVALITGASSGLGRHFAEVLAQAGAKVGLAARRIDTLQSVADGIGAAGGTAAVARLDVTQKASVDETVASIEAALGPIDILVNNSGVSLTRKVLEQTESDWDAVIDVNLSSAQLALERTTIRHNPSSR